MSLNALFDPVALYAAILSTLLAAHQILKNRANVTVLIIRPLKGHPTSGPHYGNPETIGRIVISNTGGVPVIATEVSVHYLNSVKREIFAEQSFGASLTRSDPSTTSAGGEPKIIRSNEEVHLHFELPFSVPADSTIRCTVRIRNSRKTFRAESRAGDPMLGGSGEESVAA